MVCWDWAYLQIYIKHIFTHSYVYRIIHVNPMINLAIIYGLFMCITIYIYTQLDGFQLGYKISYGLYFTL